MMEDKTREYLDRGPWTLSYHGQGDVIVHGWDGKDIALLDCANSGGRKPADVAEYLLAIHEEHLGR